MKTFADKYKDFFVHVLQEVLKFFNVTEYEVMWKFGSQEKHTNQD